MNIPEKWFVKLTKENINLINIGRLLNKLPTFIISDVNYGNILNDFTYKYEPDNSYKELSDSELTMVIGNKLAVTIK